MQMPDGIARRSQQRLIRARIEVQKTRQYGMYLWLSGYDIAIVLSKAVVLLAANHSLRRRPNTAFFTDKADRRGNARY